MSRPRRSAFLAAVLASATGTGISRILGAVRDHVVARVLGAGAMSDAFWMAFTIPNTFRRFVADEGLTGALVPAVAQAEADDGAAAAKLLADSVLSALILANIALVAVGVLGAEPLVRLVAGGFADDPDQLALTVSLTRWLFPFVATVSMVSWMEGLLNHRGHFFTPKVAPAVVNIGFIVGALVLGDAMGSPVWGLVAGVLLGGVGHVLVCLPPLIRLWGAPRLATAFGTARFRRVMTELGKVVVIGLSAQVNLLVIRYYASFCAVGSVTWFWNANRLVDLAQGVVAVAVGSALLPTASQAVAAADWDRLRYDLAQAVRLAAYVLIPAAVTLLAFAEPVTSIVFRSGAYAWSDVLQTATTLRVLVPFMLAVAGIQILKKAYFAFDDRNTLLAVGAIGVVLTAALASALTGEHGVQGLGVALSASTIGQLILYIGLLRRHIPPGQAPALGGALFRMALASLPVGGWLWFVAGLGDWSEGLANLADLGLLFGGIGLAAVAYVGGTWLLGVEETTAVVGRLARRFRRS